MVACAQVRWVGIHFNWLFRRERERLWNLIFLSLLLLVNKACLARFLWHGCLLTWLLKICVKTATLRPANQANFAHKSFFSSSSSAYCKLCSDFRTWYRVFCPSCDYASVRDSEKIRHRERDCITLIWIIFFRKESRRVVTLLAGIKSNTDDDDEHASLSTNHVVDAMKKKI